MSSIDPNEPCTKAAEAAKNQKITQVTKQKFDDLFDNNEFINPPIMDSFGNNYGDPYRPNRQAWGQLKNGEWVWAWVRGEFVKCILKD